MLQAYLSARLTFMKNTNIKAKLISWDRIRVTVFSDFHFNFSSFSLLKDGQALPWKMEKQSSFPSICIAEFSLLSPIELGHSYDLLIPSAGTVPLDVDEASTFDGFDDLFYYEGDDLGATYAPSLTRFALWAPLASFCAVKYRESSSASWKLLNMTRSPNGVYRAKLSGDCQGYQYLYLIVNSGILRESSDIYAKASMPNGEASVVIDFSCLEHDLSKDSLPVMNSPTDAIIYEGNVRDLTITHYTDIVRKGTFLGLCEKGRKTKKGHPAGFDYLVSMGFTHLQLMPIYDFKTVDERHPDASYNWGYDPAQYFVPEGSYASVVEDPLSRIRDLKTMVKAYHEAGVRIVMDVVYNHVYGFENSSFQKTVPNYYFRQRHDGSMANTSGCGDDLASERKMVRKLILDACAWWIDEYGIDGFRFDLMGIIDVNTLNAIKDMAKKKDPSFLLYGEGWNMGGEVKEPLGWMDNYRLLPEYGFFNDYYREIIKRYFAYDSSVKQDAKYVYAGSSVDFIHSPKFLDARQSINYVECHDNGTYFDYLSSVHPDWDCSQKLSAISSANAFICLSFGIPFFHQGQEIGQSKWGDGNTYNKGDHYNKFSYALLDERYAMVETLREFIAFRKKRNAFHAFSPTYLDWNLYISEEGPCIKINFLDPSTIEKEKNTTVFVNPTDMPYNLGEGKAKRLLCSSKFLGCEETEGRIVPAFSTTIIED